MPEATAAAREPRFSVIVPVYNVADYLDECLDSIRQQSCSDVEIIVIDDRSTDNSRDLAERHAQADPRVSVTALPQNVGLGGARNVGLEQARGRYVLFVDSDDTLAGGALQVVADRIDESGNPDVVLFSYARTYPDGGVLPDPRANLLAHAGAWPLDARASLLRIIPTAWNKAYRREFLAEETFTFPSGTYEDVPWSYPILMVADPLVSTDFVAYHYRQRQSSNILSGSGLVHLDLIGQYDKVFAYIDDHPEFESWRRPMFDRIAWHIPTVLETTRRIPPGSRRAFHAACVAAIRRHHPSGYRPAGRLGLKVALLEHSGYRLFRLAQLANQLRRRIDPRTN